MSKPITKTKAQIWNERFEKRMHELKYSQRMFSAIYKERFGTGSQADVSKWMHVGETDSRTNKGRKFPEFETMRNIAEILEVSVGYLIGETDCETFEMEHVSNYLKISPQSIKAICSISSGKSIPPFYKYPDPQITAALESILMNQYLIEYLKNICELAVAVSQERTPANQFEKELDKIPVAIRESVISLWSDPEEAIANGIEPTDELWTFVRIIDDAAYSDTCQPDIAEREIKSAKYALQESHIKIINELISSEKITELLPHYATQEELNKIVRKGSERHN